MFLCRKYKKLIIFFICVHKSKTILKMKQTNFFFFLTITDGVLHIIIGWSITYNNWIGKKVVTFYKKVLRKWPRIILYKYSRFSAEKIYKEKKANTKFVFDLLKIFLRGSDLVTSSTAPLFYLLHPIVFFLLFASQIL